RAESADAGSGAGGSACPGDTGRASVIAADDGRLVGTRGAVPAIGAGQVSAVQTNRLVVNQLIERAECEERAGDVAGDVRAGPAARVVGPAQRAVAAGAFAVPLVEQLHQGERVLQRPDEAAG